MVEGMEQAVDKENDRKAAARVRRERWKERRRTRGQRRGVMEEEGEAKMRPREGWSLLGDHVVRRAGSRSRY